LKTVKGGFSLESTATLDCDSFNSEKGADSVLQGPYQCKGQVSDPQPLSSGTSSGSSASSTSSKGAAPSYGVNEAVAGLSVVGGLLQMLL
jgi:hypothetical protein